MLLLKILSLLFYHFDSFAYKMCRFRLLPLLILSVFASCNVAPSSGNAEQGQDSAVFSEIVENIQSGDLALRKGNDITSNMLSQLNTKDKRFSHIGICFVESGKAFVYHSLGSEFGEAEYIRKDADEVFFNQKNNMAAAYATTRFSAAEKDSLHRLLQKWYHQKIPFDMNFNLETDDSLYCSEMVTKALMKVVPNLNIPFTDTLGRQYFGVDDIITQAFVDSIHYYSKTVVE